MCNETGPSGEQKHLVRAKKIGALRCGADDFVKTFCIWGGRENCVNLNPWKKGARKRK